jgi:SpoVK/Ycf46/Vps4 family AAA+-type ATPase
LTLWPSERIIVVEEEMDYQALKHQLRKAANLVDAGKADQADQLIRSLKGLTGADLAANLTKAQMAALRKAAKKGRK